MKITFTTLADAVADIETRFPVKEGRTDSRSQTGEEYAEVVSGGIKPKGDHFPLYAATPALAITAWHQAVLDYAEGKTGTLFWRCRPELGEVVLVQKGIDLSHLSPNEAATFDTPLWRVYSRMLISDLPELTETEARIVHLETSIAKIDTGIGWYGSDDAKERRFEHAAELTALKNLPAHRPGARHGWYGCLTCGEASPRAPNGVPTFALSDLCPGRKTVDAMIDPSDIAHSVDRVETIARAVVRRMGIAPETPLALGPLPEYRIDGQVYHAIVHTFPAWHAMVRQVRDILELSEGIDQ